MLQRKAPPSDLFFRGRSGDPRLGEWVIPLDTLDALPPSRHRCVLYGSPDDKGVELNKGRVGARFGPDAIRKMLYRMALPMDHEWEKSLSLGDWGNCVPSTDILETHRRSQEMAKAAAKSGAVGIALGGGHDFAAPHFLGFKEGTSTRAKARFGLINIDPHLDVRPWENRLPHSGTGFRTLLDSKTILGKDFVEFGARASRNAREHYEYCRLQGVKVLCFEELQKGPKSCVQKFQTTLKALAAATEFCGVSVDMDCCKEIEGVSAPAVVGFSAWELCQMAYHAGREKKVRHFELCELAPPLDPTERSSRVAAELIYYFLRGRSEI